MLTDLKYAFRMLIKAPVFAVIAILTLALGIGANSAIFSAVKPTLFESLPYPHAERLVAMFELHGDGSRGASTFGIYQGLVERQHSLVAMAVLKPWRPTLTGPNEPERFEGQ